MAKKIVNTEENDQKMALVIVSDNVVPMTGDEPYADIRRKAVDLRDAMNSSRWDLAEALHRIKSDTVYRHWGYNSWDSYIENEIGFTGRTVSYLTSMYDWFVVEVGRELTVDHLSQVVERVKSLGWTKSRLLVNIATADKVDHWLDKAEKLSCSELESVTRAEVSTKEKKRLDKEGLDQKVTFTFSGEQKETVDRAIETAAAITGSDKRGHCLQLVCQNFIATNFAQKDDGRKNVGKFFDQQALVFGVQVIIVDRESGRVIHGDKVLKRISEQQDAR